jgi:hypothetical protein
MNEIVKQLFTGKDNKTYDLGRISWAVCVFATIGFAIYEIVHNISFTLEDFGRSIAAVVGVHAAGIWAKKDTEPPVTDDGTNDDSKKPLTNEDISK